MAHSLIYSPTIPIPTQPPGPSPLRPQPWPAAAPPGQQLFGLVGEDGTVSFHHAGQRGGDPRLQKPLHTHVYEVLLVLGRRKGGSGEGAWAPGQTVWELKVVPDN